MANGKLILKNTVLLYIRMLFTMLINLYTSRIVLYVLGVSDFGLHNVVGGVVMMFSFLNVAMSVGIQRFFSFEIGRGESINKLFIASIYVQLTVAVFVAILSETIGLWFLNNKLVVPEDRIIAANWVYQSAIVTFVLMIVTVPYSALLISKEKMNVYAYISIADSALKLIVVYSLMYLQGDKLKIYASLLLFNSLCTAFSYIIYCSFKYKECKYRFYSDVYIYKRLINYSVWNLFGGVSTVCNNYGINVVLNLFFGTTVNAARGIAYQVNAAITNFTSNFQTAMNPQIVKSYAINDYVSMQKLIYRGSKYSFFLLLFVILPVMIHTPFLLHVWLNIVPNNSVLFTRLVLITSLIDCISGPLMIASQASGNIRIYQSIVGSLTLLNLPLAYFLISYFNEPVYAFISSIIISIIALFVRLLIVSKLVPIKMFDFVRDVLSYVVVGGIIVSTIPFLLCYKIDHTWCDFLYVCLICWGWASIVYFCLCTKEEKVFIYKVYSNLKNRV